MQRDILVLISGLVAFVAILISAVSMYLLPHLPLVWQISGGISLVALIVYLVQNQFFRKALATRTARYGLNSIAMCFVVLAIVVVINLIATEHDVKKDVTKNQIHMLSAQSQKVVKNLKNEVKMIAFVYPQEQPEFQKVFDKYTYYSKMLKPEFIDLDKDYLAVKRYKIKQKDTVILESENRSTRVENIFSADDPKMEEKLTNAIIQVAKGEKKKAYFTTGHGERLLSDTGREGYSEIKEALENSRFKVEDLSLIEKQKIPSDADLIVSLGPKSDFLPQEITLLENYIKGGGKALFLVDPYSTPTLEPLFTKFGVNWKNKKTIYETNALQQLAGGDPLTPVVTTYDPSHEITQELKPQQLTIFPFSTPLEKSATAPKDYKLTSLFSTSSRSFEADVQGNKVKVNQQKKGPFALGIAVSGKVDPKLAAQQAASTDSQKKADKEPKNQLTDKKAPETKEAKEEKTEKDNEFRLVVVGDSEFASNGARRLATNSDLFQNMLSWLSKEEDLIAIRPKSTDTSNFELTAERSRLIYLSSMFPAFALFLGGVMVRMSRRRR